MLKEIMFFLNEPFHIPFFIFLGASFFLGLTITVAVSVVFSIKLDRHLKKHYFEQWKLSRGTNQQRKRVIVPKDSYYNEVVKQQHRIHKWIAYAWVASVIIAAIFIFIYQQN